MKCECINHDFGYDINHLVKIFNVSEHYRLITILDEMITVELYHEDSLVHRESEEVVNDEHAKNQMKRIAYRVLNSTFECLSEWGILVGIRPVKIVHELLDNGMKEADIPSFIRDEYYVSDEKIKLLMEIALRERAYLYPIDKRAVSLYICIPFCPTRCVYCSFPSNDVVKKKNIVDDYVEALRKEIREMGATLIKNGYYVDCVYVGGGTPTALNAEQLNRVLHSIADHMPIKNLKEWTVEAGRPDSINREKLDVIGSYPITRLCLNPQTMNEKTLQVIGRKHTVDDIYKVHSLMRFQNVSSINMDLILGLPGETTNDVKSTLENVIDLKPENITIHTLAVKRASKLNENRDDYTLDDGSDVIDMLMMSGDMLRANGYVPYYMYRQKNMLGNLENVGYCLEGHESLYNMRIMEERHTILALGAGSQSKMCFPDENRFERVSNSKGVEDYIKRVDEMISKKLTYFETVDES